MVAFIELQKTLERVYHGFYWSFDSMTGAEDVY